MRNRNSPLVMYYVFFCIEINHSTKIFAFILIDEVFSFLQMKQFSITEDPCRKATNRYFIQGNIVNPWNNKSFLWTVACCHDKLIARSISALFNSSKHVTVDNGPHPSLHWDGCCVKNLKIECFILATLFCDAILLRMFWVFNGGWALGFHGLLNHYQLFIV